MEILEFLGYFGAILVGLILGLIGGGGSILTLPILVYLLGVNAVTATGYSLFIIGITSLVGTLRNAKEKKIDFKIGLLFTIPTLLSLYFTRLVILPSIPIEILSIGDFILMKPMAIMILFAAIMLLASYSMIKGRKDEEVDKKTTNFAKLSFVGLGVGLLSGLVGAGGGFIITPALVFFAYLPMKNAVATSIFIIAVNSLLGFTGDIGKYEMDWPFLVLFSSLSIVGIFIGIYLTRFISGPQLKKGFGWFVLIMGTFILLKEIFL
ncbi:MAG: sulfite exporter TauE/SafE family protein [Crocinitomicaceae bacterium]|jgi:uncharacterized membrane protein YfcA|nr:sulfite exporter TauE/SafE family protein [Crocinitomicaceae bacterium]